MFFILNQVKVHLRYTMTTTGNLVTGPLDIDLCWPEITYSHWKIMIRSILTARFLCHKNIELNLPCFSQPIFCWLKPELQISLLYCIRFVDLNVTETLR